MSPRFAVGIDLGTTHTVVAYAPLEGGETRARVFAVLQAVSAGEVDEGELFPSVLYAPAPGERTPDPFGDV